MSSYVSAHDAVRRAWGPAALHACMWCGCTAQDWAYDGSDNREERDERGVYSEDVYRYMPLCRRCHRRYDVTIHRHGSMRAADFDRLKSAAWDRITDERRELDAGRRDTQIRLWLAWNGYADKTPEPEPTEPEQAPIVRAAICVREGCHEVVPYRGKGRPAKFCSTTCRSGSDRTEKATACRVCGVQIPQSGTGRPRVTCSAQCRQVIFKARKRTQIEADRSTARREYEAAMGDE